ncbi:MAG TPA: phosphotransferase family protein [Alphaproteobacteria bacterium]|nr:phosphotransferase family protein [Alphaproteobacteria bacterium]
MTQAAEQEAGNATIPVREAHRFDEEALRRYMAAHMDGVGETLEARQFPGGQSNPTFLIRTGGRDYVMRKKPPGKLLPSAHQVEREYRVMTALQNSDVPVPRTYFLCEDEAVLGTPFFVMDKVPGRVLEDPTLPDFEPAERSAVYDDLLRVLAALHKVDYEAAGLGELGRHGNYYERQIGRWSKQYVASQTEEIATMDRLMEWLPRHVPQDATETLVHGDYRLGNTIVAPGRPRIAAVLDWELCTFGHPLADLAYCYVACFSGLHHEAVPRAGLPSEEEFIGRYCAMTGRDGIPDWTFYKVFQLFRLAAIVQGVYKRGLDGIASSAKALEYGHVCRERADKAWAMVEEQGLDR